MQVTARWVVVGLCVHHMVEVGFEKGFGCWIVKVSLLVI